MDRAYQAWEDYFGPLPPDPSGQPYQMTGYLMADRERFRSVGLLPEDLPDFLHGRHRGQEFWMDDQPFGYYRRHLMIHEGTHCFMTALPDARAPVWYMEGMAEFFGTHKLADDGTARFGVMPDDREAFAGQGRITSLADEIAAGRALSLFEVTHTRPNDFLKTSAYAWAWALCTFLDTHPHYRDRFRQLRAHRHDGRFGAVLTELFTPDLPELQTEWRLFTTNLQYGYQIEPAAIVFRQGEALNGTEPRTAEVLANRGWQSSGVSVEQGRFYRLEAAGRFTLADEPRPWISEPQGITFRYFHGMPLGVLLATIHDPAVPDSMLQVLPVGREKTFQAPRTGTLYLRVNDDWSQLTDNTGSITVQVRAMPSE
jgi:hypothetical protein